MRKRDSLVGLSDLQSNIYSNGHYEQCSYYIANDFRVTFRYPSNGSRGGFSHSSHNNTVSLVNSGHGQYI